MKSATNYGGNNFEPDKKYMELQEAIYAKNLVKIQQIIAGGIDINQPYWLEAVTPLEIAVESENN